MLDQKTPEQLFKMLKAESVGGRDPEVSAPLLEELRLRLGFGTNAEFARALDVPWVTLHRWLKKVSCPRRRYLNKLQSLVRRELDPRRIWIIADPEHSASRMIEELDPTAETERFYVHYSGSATAFRSFRRKLKLGGLPEIGQNLDLLRGKIVGMLVDASEYPMFMTGVSAYLIEFSSGDEVSIEGYIGLPSSGKSEDKSIQSRYTRVDDRIAQLWYESCQLLSGWYSLHKNETEKMEEFEVTDM